MVIEIILCFIWLILIPFLNGKFLVKEENNTILYTWILGHLFQMGVFLICSVPLILLRESFTKLWILYSIIIMLLSIVSFIVNKKKFIFKNKFKQIYEEVFKNFSLKKFIKNISIFQIMSFILIGMILIIKINYTSINDDDSSFVALSQGMISSNKMYLETMEGVQTSMLNARRALAPISAYYATLSMQLRIHSTIVTHTVMPIIFIFMSYILYYYFAKKIFKEKDSIYIFLIFLYLLYIYTFEVKGYNRYFILYTWFGRALLGGLILPFIWKVSFDAMNKEKNKLIDWLNIFVLVNAGCLGTEMAVPLIPISLVSLSIVNGIRDKKITYLLKSLLCIIPCAILGFIYLKIK